MRRLISLAALALVVGCQAQTYTERQKVDTEPLTVDQAMQQRNWDTPVIAAYENGDTKSASTGFAYKPDRTTFPYSYAAIDTASFLINVATLPFTFCEQRDGVTSGGVKLPPSYTAVPPLPPSTQPTE